MDIPTTTHTGSALRKWGRLSCFTVLALGSMLGLAGTSATLLSRGWWRFELATHFTAHWAVGLGVLLVGWLAMRHWRWVVVCTLCLAWHVAQIVPLYLPGSIPEPTGPTLRVVSQNVFTHNRNYQAVLDLVEREEPDILLLLEVNRRWLRDLAPLQSTYPYTLHQPSRDNFGIAVYAKEPWAAAEVVRLGKAGIPSVVVTVDTASGPLQIVGTHTVPPISARYADFRNDQLHQIGEFVASRGLPTMVIGDFNTTCWSPVFHDLLKEGYLRNTQRGYGISPTWTLHNMPGIPIDHALVTKGVAVGDRRIGPQIGSDHRAVIIDVAVAREELW